jgi:hypothetical protein
MNNFSIQHQLTLKEYRQLNFKMLYSKVWFIILTVFAVLFLLWSVILYFMQSYAIFNNSLYSIGVGLTAAAIYLPIATLIRGRLLFKGNLRLSEPINYDLSEEGVAVTGESFNGIYTWEKVPKIKIINGWLLIYQNRTAANLIKTESADNDNIQSLKVFLEERYPQVKLK